MNHIKVFQQMKLELSLSKNFNHYISKAFEQQKTKDYNHLSKT
jgi:hypothetical protein